MMTVISRMPELGGEPREVPPSTRVQIRLESWAIGARRRLRMLKRQLAPVLHALVQCCGVLPTGPRERSILDDYDVLLDGDPHLGGDPYLDGDPLLDDYVILHGDSRLEVDPLLDDYDIL